MNKKINIFDEESLSVSTITDTSNDLVIVTDNVEKVIKLYDIGPPGPSGATPFRLVSGNYKTDEIVAFGSYISSSLIPIGNFDVGSESNPFQRGYFDTIDATTYYGDGSNLTGIESVVPYTILANDGTSVIVDQNDLLFSTSSFHGFGFTVDGTTTKRIRLTTPQGLRTTDSPTFNGLTIDDELITNKLQVQEVTASYLSGNGSGVVGVISSSYAVSASYVPMNFDDLLDVIITAPTNNQYLQYDSAVTAWVNRTLSFLAGAIANGQIAFGNGTDIGGSSNLTWDNANTMMSVVPSTGRLRIRNNTLNFQGLYPVPVGIVFNSTSDRAGMVVTDNVAQVVRSTGIQVNVTYPNKTSAISVLASGTVTMNVLTGGGFGIVVEGAGGGVYRSPQFTANGTITQPGYGHWVHQYFQNNGSSLTASGEYINYGSTTQIAVGPTTVNAVSDYYTGAGFGPTNGTITNRYNIDIRSTQSTTPGQGVTNNWGIYQTDANTKSAFNGNVIIGALETPTAKLQVKGSGNTSATSALIVENSDGTDALDVRNDSLVIARRGILVSGGSTSAPFAWYRAAASAAGDLLYEAFGNLSTGTFFRANVNNTHIPFEVKTGGTVIRAAGSTSISTAATLEVQSTTGGILFPRMTSTQRDAIVNPPDGLVLFNTTATKLQVRAGGVWVDLH